MKRFSIFCAALFVAVTSFATVAYELNGGVTNDYGWMDKGDMYAALLADINAITPSQNAGFSTATLEGDKAKGQASLGIPTYWADLAVLLTNETFLGKWQWLVTYMDGICSEQSKSLPSSSSTYLRYNLAAFFIETDAETYLHAHYGQAGLPAAFIPAWKHAFANPTEPTAEWVLNAPYKEGLTFDGWYAAADFSGEKVIKIDANTTGTLYAKWVEYVPTIAEVKALADDTETKVAGVVNFISGKNLYIQDATGGILVYTAENPTCKVGDKIVAKGVKVIYGGAPEVKNVVIEKSEVSEELLPITPFENLAVLLADTTFKHFATRVSVPGVKIASYDDHNNPTVVDALGNQAKCYKMVLDPVAYPIGAKVTVTAVAAWCNGFQFVGDAAGIELVIIGKKEQYTYPERSNGRYTLKNNWVISIMEDNFTANKPGSDNYVRGMAAKDGIMYFINRETKSIVRVDAATAEMLEPIKLQGTDSLFMIAGTDSAGNKEWGKGCELPYNDIKFDQAGNCLIGCCVINDKEASNQRFYVYLVDLETGECTKLIEDYIRDNEGLNGVMYRFDAFGVAGDVTKNGVIMAADALGSWNVYRWLINDGVAGEGEQVAVLLDPAVDQSLYINAAGYGTAPQIFPQDETGSLFYVDGFNMLPMLFYGTPEAGAILVDDFINVPAGTKVTNNEGEVLSMNTGHNGLVEFQVGEEYFLLITASNTAANPPSSFALYKFADADRTFDGMTPLWYFPHKGMGSSQNGCRTAVPSVDVISDTQAVLYVYTNNNGYATYTLTIDPTIADNTAVEDIEAVKVGAEKVVENGQIFILKNGVKYNALGAEVK